jgi:hypothetical protein
VRYFDFFILVLLHALLWTKITLVCSSIDPREWATSDNFLVSRPWTLTLINFEDQFLILSSDRPIYTKRTC